MSLIKTSGINPMQKIVLSAEGDVSISKSNPVTYTQHVDNHHFTNDVDWDKLGDCTISNHNANVVGIGLINSTGVNWCFKQEKDIFFQPIRYIVKFRVRALGANVKFQVGAEYDIIFSEPVPTEWTTYEVVYNHANASRHRPVFGGELTGIWEVDYLTIETKDDRGSYDEFNPIRKSHTRQYYRDHNEDGQDTVVCVYDALLDREYFALINELENESGVISNTGNLDIDKNEVKKYLETFIGKTDDNLIAYAPRLFRDFFVGQEIDLDAWEVFNPTPSRITFHQDDALILRYNEAANGVSSKEALLSYEYFDEDTLVVVFDIRTDNAPNNDWQVGLFSGAEPLIGDDKYMFFRQAVAGRIGYYCKEENVTLVNSYFTGYDTNIKQTLKFIATRARIDFYIWIDDFSLPSGGSWLYKNGVDFSLGRLRPTRLWISGRSLAVNLVGDESHVTNLSCSNVDFDTKYPR